MSKDKPIIISLGGSLVVPNGGIDTEFLSQFNQFIRNKIARKWRFFIVVGGGATARHYIEGAKNIVGNITDWDLDYLGIHATRLNAHVVRTIFQDVAHPRIITNYEKKIETITQPVVVAAGWKPGFSTDYDAVVLARDYGGDTVINLSNIKCVYDKDPNRSKDAKPLKSMSWNEFEILVGDKWIPGSNLPFDPKATKLAKKLNLRVFVLGNDLENLDQVLQEKPFIGTLISI